MYLKNSEPSVPGIIREEHTCLHSEPIGKRRRKKKKNPGINLGQPVGKGRNFIKKNPGINPGQPAGKRRNFKKKNPGINPGQLAGKGRKKKKTPDINTGQIAGPRFQDLDLDFKTWSSPSVEVLSIRRGPETKIDTSTNGRTRQLL
jgi:hypothetical protein